MGGISVAASLNGFADIRDDVERFCDRERLSHGTCRSLTLVLEELLVNVVKYGYRGRMGPVVLSLTVQNDRLVGEIVDEGAPFDPTAAPEPDIKSALEERPVGGLGIHLVRNMVDELRYERDGGRNVLNFAMTIDDWRRPEDLP